MSKPKIDPVVYVVKVVGGFVIVPFEWTEHRNYGAEFQAATRLTAEQVIEQVRDLDISLVHDPRDGFSVQWMHGRDLMVDLLNGIRAFVPILKFRKLKGCWRSA